MMCDMLTNEECSQDYVPMLRRKVIAPGELLYCRNQNSCKWYRLKMDLRSILNVKKRKKR